MEERLQQFTEKAKTVHGDRYDYSQITEYKNSTTKLPIVCREHGVFLQTADGHINQKHGCPKCNKQGGKGGYTHSYFENNPADKEIPGVLYAVQITNSKEKFVKIGITAKTVTHRFNRTEYKNMRVEVIHERSMTLYEAFCAEQRFIEMFQSYRFYSNTPFSGYTECFQSKPEVLAELHNLFINITP